MNTCACNCDLTLRRAARNQYSNEIKRTQLNKMDRMITAILRQYEVKLHLYIAQIQSIQLNLPNAATSNTRPKSGSCIVAAGVPSSNEVLSPALQFVELFH